MRKYLFLVFILLLLFQSCNDDIRLNVISLNIRYDNPADAENAWPNRKDIVIDFLQNESPDIFGLQEVLWHQYHYIDSILLDYGSVTAGRDDGKKSGEMCPVFYNKSRYDLRGSDTFWLSETPGLAGSKGWGAVLPRVVTWVKLFDKLSEKEIYFFNTHFSHMSDSARLMSSRVLSDQIFSIAADEYFVLCGDFNMSAESKAYLTLRERKDLIYDSYLLTETDPLGPMQTFNGFKNLEGGARIDYIFTSKGVKVNNHITHNIRDGDLFISDHWPIEVSLEIK